MNEGVRAEGVPAEGEHLDDADDATLRGIAYGRADTDGERMRARTASRILASRHPAANHKLIADDHAGDDLDDATDSEEIDPEEITEKRARRRRTVLAGAIAASLVVGAGIGVAVERTGAVMGADSLAVFDRPGTPEEATVVSLAFGSQVTGEARLLSENDAVRAYGIRVEGDGVFLGGDTGPQICVIAIAESRVYYPSGCVPEVIFRDQGTSGFLASLEVFISESTFVGGLGYTWGPRGDIALRDYTDELLGAAEDRFSEEDLARGLDIPAIRLLENTTLVSTADLGIEDVELGPAEIGRIGTTLLLASVRQPTLLVRDPKGGTRPASDVQRVVCLTPLRDGAVAGTFCASVGQFREEGLRASFDADSGTVQVDWSPRGDLTVEDL